MKRLWLFIFLGFFFFSFLNNVLLVPKSQLASLLQLQPVAEPEIIKQKGREAVIAKIYSTYPFNHRNLITVNAGSVQGISEDSPVTVDGNFLLGKVVGLWEQDSLVRTIFDRDFSLSVRIGEKGVNALLAGGQNPRLTLIEKNASVAEGDVVYSAAKGIPYGIKIGKISDIREGLTTSFKEGNLELSYQLKELREVAILIK